MRGDVAEDDDGVVVDPMEVCPSPFYYYSIPSSSPLLEWGYGRDPIE